MFLKSKISGQAAEAAITGVELEEAAEPAACWYSAGSREGADTPAACVDLAASLEEAAVPAEPAEIGTYST